MQITQNKTWDIPQEIMDELATDLLTTAAEGGINYWAAVTAYRWSAPVRDRFVSVEDVADDNKSITITVESIIDAIRKLVSGEAKEFYGGYDKTFKTRLIELFNEIENNKGIRLLDCDFDYDASDADDMFQIACFGELVYG